MPNFKEILGEMVTGVLQAKVFLKYLLLSTLLVSVFLMGGIVSFALWKEHVFTREVQQSKIYLPGKSSVETMLTAEDLAFPTVPMPVLDDYYLWRNDQVWTEEEIERYWDGADLMPLAELEKKNRDQLQRLLDSAR